MAGLKFDEIGLWSELKLEIVEKYGAAYTKAFKNANLKKYYIDAFSGAGIHISKGTGTKIEGSTARALKTSPSYDGYYFIDLDKNKTEHLRKVCGNRPNVHIHTGDANQYLTKELFLKIQYKNFNRALCLLDPYGLDLDWAVIFQAGQSGAIDMFLNFPVMDMNRNAIWKNYDQVPKKGIERMNRFWGDESWKQAAYSEESDLFGPIKIKQGNIEIVNAFAKRLKEVAGFKYVPEPLPMKNSQGTVVYYLFFATPKYVARKIIIDIFDRYR